MPGINFQIKPVLEGTKVILRPFEPDDWEKMLILLADPEVRRLTGSVSSDEEAAMADSEKEVEAMKQWYQSRNQQADRLDLAIVEKSSGELVGEAVFNHFDGTTPNVNFRILIGANGRDRGLGTEAVALFIRYGFETLGLHRIELDVYSFNPRAEKVYRKNGFILEGIRRESFIYNGEYIDTKIFAMLKSDYERYRREHHANCL